MAQSQAPQIAAILMDASLRNLPLEIFCDEAGHTGPKLLDPAQRIFSYAAVAISDDEAWQILDDARKAHPVQMPELKSSKLLNTVNGRALALEVLKKVQGRYSFVLFDKLLALCGKIFGYIYEPVFQDDPELLYRKNLHRFVAMYCYVFFTVKPSSDGRLGEPDQGDGEQAIREFEWFMRTLDPARAPLLFDNTHQRATNDPFGIILQFSQGYKHIIVRDNAEIANTTPDQGKWTLDIGIAALWSLLNHWGQTGRPLRVKCDDSKPLRAMAPHISGNSDDPAIRRAVETFHSKERFGWKMDGQIEFGDSRGHPALQIADIVAGYAVAVVSSRGETNLQPIAEQIIPHLHPHSVMPDFDIPDLKNREAAVNWLILHELARRATRGENPYAGLEELYRQAEIAWARGEFYNFQNSSK